MKQVVINRMIEEALNKNTFNEIADLITLKQLMNYYAEQSAEKGVTNITCPLCGNNHKIVNVSITQRYVKFLFTFLYKTKQEYKKNKILYKKITDVYIHYSDVQLLTEKVFGYRVTSYAFLASYPYSLIEKKDLNDKSGEYRLTTRGLRFLKGELNIPQTIKVMNKQVIKVSDETVNVNTAKNFNLKKTINKLNSY